MRGLVGARSRPFFAKCCRCSRVAGGAGGGDGMPILVLALPHALGY
jgi:hypothetical protein